MRPIIVMLMLTLLSAAAVAQDVKRIDTQGRRFSGVGDEVFVEQPLERSGYAERRSLYRFPPDSRVTDIEIRGNDLYVLALSALYRITGDAQPTKLLWGIPRGPGEQGFRALAWGPEGDLYCSFGDADPSKRWRHWSFFSQPAGTKTPYSGIGGVVRCKPDGTDLRVVSDLVRDAMPLKRADEPPAERYDAMAATPEKLWRELSDPSWPRRHRAHAELQRRGGDLLVQANKRILDAPLRDPALPHLIWLAARSQRGSLHLLSLVADPDPLVRLQVVRALTEYPEQLRDEPIFTRLLTDADSRVQQAAMLAHFSPKIAWGEPMQSIIERGPARSDEPLLRQTATRLLAAKATRAQIERLCGRFDPSWRLAGVLAAGYRLTLPAATKPLHAQLPLAKLRDESAYVIDYADGRFDLRDHGRIGTFTVAEHWRADMHTEEQEGLFKLLRKMLADEDESVRVQAARFLAVLDDSRCAADVARVLKK